MAKIQIEIHTGHASPWSGELEQSEITIGRADSADVRLHPTKDTACTRGIHARIVRSDDVWELLVDHDSGVHIVDQHGKVKRECGPGERIAILGETYFEIGNAGPRLSATPVGDALPVTDRRVHGGQVPLPVGRVSGDVVKKANTAPKLIAGTLALLVIVGAGLAYWILDVRHRGRTDVIDMTLAIQEETDEMRRETQQSIGELRQVLSERADLTAAQLALLEDSMTQLREQPSDRMYEVLVDASDSVWLVGVYDLNTGGFRGGGTAWTVTPGNLATNAHVADSLLEGIDVAKGLVPVARREGLAANQVQLSTDMLVHPGYHRWAQRLNQQLELLPGGVASMVQHIAPYDVALLSPLDPAADLGAPLPLAENVDQRSLEGITIGYAGFPSENIAGQPTLHRVSGRISSQTDFLFSNGEILERHLIHYTAPTAGGASGSPMLDEHGDVIGLVSAGSIIPVDGKRAPVGFNYAQRVDILQELLAGQHEEQQSLRDVRIAEALRQVRVSPEQFLDRLTAEFAQGEPHGVSDFEISLNGAGFQQGHTLDLTLPPGRAFLFVVVSHDWLDVKYTGLVGSNIAMTNHSPMWFAFSEADAVDREIVLSLTVFTLNEIENPPSRATLRVVSKNGLAPPEELFE